MNYLFIFTKIQEGYNDDLVMSFSIALWVRDTALRLQKDRNTQQWAMMDSIVKNNGNKPADDSVGFKKGKPGMPKTNPYEMDTGTNDKEDLTWLIG